MRNILNKKKIIFILLLAVCMYSEIPVYCAESNDALPVKSYKFHMLKDKISSLNGPNYEDTDSVLISNKKNGNPLNTDTTSENIIINEIDGIKVIKNNPAKAVNESENTKKKYSGKPAMFIENRLRWENNNYRMNGGNNFNNSTVINRTRLNVKYDLNENVSANFYSDEN